MADVLAISKNLGLEDFVRYVGLLEGADRFSIFKACDLFVLTSYSENFGMSVIEAMASGLPVLISNNVGIHNEISSEAAGIVTSMSPIDISNKIDCFLSNHHMIKSLCDVGPIFVEKHYEYSVVSRSLYLKYRDIIDAF